MTSEGQQAGQQPAEATSGSPAQAFGPDGFPPDSEARSRGSAQPGSGFPTSYAPPPQTTPNGGSPFVVPTVFGQSAERSLPDPPADRYGIPTAPSGQANSADGDRTTPPPFAPPASGYTPPPATGSGSPFGPASPPSRDNSSPPSAWPPREAAASAQFPPTQFPPTQLPPAQFPPTQLPPAQFPPAQFPPAQFPPAQFPPAQLPAGQFPADDPFGRSAEPHPYHLDDGSAGEIAGFAPGSPTRGRGGLDDDPRSGSPFELRSGSDRPESAQDSEQSPFAPPARPESPGANRPPGLSAFGDQRVRVPGATLTDLPDGVPPVPPVPPAREPNSGGVTRRDGDGSALPRRTAPSGDPLLSFGSTADSFQGFKPTGSGRAGGSADSRGSSAGSYTPRASQAFAANRGPGSQGPSGGQPSGEQAGGGYPSGGQTSAGPASGAPGDSPFGRQPGEPFGAQPQSDSPFGSQSEGAPPFGGRPSGDSPFGAGSGRSSAPPSASPYGSGPTSDGFQFGAPPVPAGGSPFRPAPAGSPFGETVSDEPMFGSRSATADDAAQPYASTGPDGSPPFGQQTPFGPGADSPFARRVPGASLGSDAAPVAPVESRNGSIPHPRDPAERPAMGTARPVSASASVPTASRVAPDDAEELPPPSAVPQARVYGRAAPPTETDDDAGGDDHPMYARPERDDHAVVSPYAHDPENQNAPATYGRPVHPDLNDQSGAPYDQPVDPDLNAQGSPYGQHIDPQPDGRGSPYGQHIDPQQDGHGGSAGFGPAPFGRPADADRIDPGNSGTPYGRPVGPDQDGQAGQPGFGATPFGQPSDANPNSPGGPTPLGRPADADQSGPAAFGPGPFTRPGAEDPNSPGGFGTAPVSPYPRRFEDDQNGPGGNPGSAGTQPPAVAPQSPGRVSGRATASARVTPPPGGLPGAPTPPDHYGEHTTDISRRGPSDQPYVPAPALPSLHARPPLENGFPPPPDGTESPDRMRMGGMFPGPANRGTVTPPNPDETTSWPQQREPQQSQNVGWPQSGEPEEDRFAQFKPDDAAPAAAAPSSPHVRMVPTIIGVIIGAALVVGIGLGIVWLIARGSHTAGISVGAGDCVKRSGDQAIKATCGDPGTFQVVSVAATKEQCGDPTQPYVVNPTDNGKTQVLCLKPSS